MAKTVYGELVKMPFKATILRDKAPFSDKTKVGNTFKYAAELTMEHGGTYNGTTGSEATLNDAIVMESAQTDISAYEFHMRTRITTRTFAEALSQGATAFANATKQRIMALQAGVEFRLEHSLHYGQEGIFQVSSIDTGVITITNATWNAPTAIRLINAKLEAFDAQTASANQHNADLTVTGVDLDAKTITVSGTSSSVVANDWLYFKGARSTTAFNEMAGFHKLMTTTSGTLLGINVGTYPWFKPNVSSSFGRPTMLLVLKAMRKLVGRDTLAARKDERQNTTLLVPSVSYEILNSDLMSSRRFDGSYERSRGTTGVESIVYYGQTGPTELLVDPLIRDGDMMAFGPDNLFRVGTHDVKFDLGPDDDSDLWNQVADKTSYEARANFILHPALLAPGRTIAMTGVTE
jgi:hypothetical protein